jgi:hypothetical protein
MDWNSALRRLRLLVGRFVAPAAVLLIRKREKEIGIGAAALAGAFHFLVANRHSAI